MPYWLRHHVSIFDNGIMIDHGATDRTVEIIRELSPHWEVRETKRCKEGFFASETDKEVMGIEEELSGWKMVLNVTEFLLIDDLDGYIQALPESVKGVTTSGVVLIDTPDTRFDEVTEDPIFFQKTNGYFEFELGIRPEDNGQPGVHRSRLLHCYPNGKYEIGRHVTHVEHIYDRGLFLAWTGWAPFEKIKDMKYAVQTRIPASEFSRGFSHQHNLRSMEELEQNLAAWQRLSHNLLSNARYLKILKKLGYQGPG